MSKPTTQNQDSNLSNNYETIRRSIEDLYNSLQESTKTGYQTFQTQSISKTVAQIAVALNGIAAISPDIFSNTNNQSFKTSLENFQREASITTANAMLGAFAASSIATSLGLNQQAKGVSAIGGAIIANIPMTEEVEAAEEKTATRKKLKKSSKTPSHKTKKPKAEKLQLNEEQKRILSLLSLFTENGDADKFFEHLKILETSYPDEAKNLIKKFRSKDKKTFLHLAAISKNKEIVKKLISLGCDIDERDNNSATPLMYVAINGDLDLFKDLIAARADINKKTEKNKETDGNVTLLSIAATNNNLAIVKFLVEEKKVNIDEASDVGDTPLIEASNNGHLPIVRFLLKNGARTDLKGGKGFTAMQTALSLGHIEIFKIISEEEKKQRELKKKNHHKKPKVVNQQQTSEITEEKSQDQSQSSKSAAQFAYPDAIKKITESTQQVSKLDIAKYLENEEVNRKKSSEEKPSNSPGYSLAGLFSAAIAGVAAIGAGIWLNRGESLQEKNRIEQETNKLAEEMKEPLIEINEYIARYQLLKIEEIKSLEWKKSSQSLVLEMKSQPHDLKDEIEKVFTNPQFKSFVKITNETVTERRFTDEGEVEVNLNKKTISLETGSLAKNQQKDQIISTIRNSLNLIGKTKNNELEMSADYKILLEDSIDPVNKELTRDLIFNYASGEKLLDALKLQRLLYLGRITYFQAVKHMSGFSTESDLSLGHEALFSLPDLQKDDNGIVLPGELEKHPWEQWKEIIRSRDVIGKEFKIGTRIGADEKSYLVRFPKNKDDSLCLGMTIEEREPKFFRLIKNHLGEFIAGPEINLSEAERLLKEISRPNPQIIPRQQNQESNPNGRAGRVAGNGGGGRGAGNGR